MADSIYRILELRCIDNGDSGCDLYIRISQPNYFMYVAGWYKQALSATDLAEFSTLRTLDAALATQSFLQWERIAPPTPDDSERQPDAYELQAAYVLGWTHAYLGERCDPNYFMPRDGNRHVDMDVFIDMLRIARAGSDR